MVSEVVSRLYREESGRILATLIRLLGDFDLAEEVVQEAFQAALDPLWGEAPGAGAPRAARRVGRARGGESGARRSAASDLHLLPPGPRAGPRAGQQRARAPLPSPEARRGRAARGRSRLRRQAQAALPSALRRRPTSAAVPSTAGAVPKTWKSGRCSTTPTPWSTNHFA